MNRNSTAIILRWGLAFVFFYAAIAALLQPENWVMLFPSFLVPVLPARTLLLIFSVYEMILAAFLFSGRKLYWFSLAAAITLAAVVVFNFEMMDVVFRDVGLATAALALFEIARDKKLRKEEEEEELV